MSYRGIINSVLRRLREDTIASDWSGALEDSSDPDDYQKLIGELVNEAKQIVEDSWEWTSLRSIVDITTSAATSSYTITGGTDRSRVKSVFDDTNDNMLRQLSDDMFYHYKYTGSTTNSLPTDFRLASGTTMEFYPTPDGTYTIRAHMLIPQADLTLAATELTVPQHPVVLGAYSLALAERGEDGGTSSDVAALRFHDALSDAIAFDEARTIGETTWYAP